VVRTRAVELAAEGAGRRPDAAVEMRYFKI